MRIALTGGSGRVGSAVIAAALARGDSVVNIDRVASDAPAGVTPVRADVTDYDSLVQAFVGCDAVIHLAAIPVPFKDPDHVVHNNNVVGSYNALRAAVEVGIGRVCQASSVNAIGLSFSRAPRFDYFPLDEHHPSYTEEPYGLSKWICEQQADAFARRYSDLQIASLRFHWVVERDVVAKRFRESLAEGAKQLWGYTLPSAAADACLRSLESTFGGHEVFYIVAPDAASDVPSLELAARHYPGVPVTGDLSAKRSFFSSRKAERLLGWKHP